MRELRPVPTNPDTKCCDPRSQPRLDAFRNDAITCHMLAKRGKLKVFVSSSFLVPEAASEINSSRRLRRNDELAIAIDSPPRSHSLELARRRCPLLDTDDDQ
jgi:hypothetical protein